MLGAVLLVLVLVCVNVANLMLVRGSDRAHELAIRTALGADRWRLVRQMLIESLTLAMAGAAAGLLVARLAMSAIVALGAGTIPRLTALSLHPRVLAFSLVVATISAVGFGLAPAIRASRTQPTDALRAQSRTSTSGMANMRLREWLVVAQVALAFMLLVGAGLLISSLDRLQHVDLGVKTANVLTFELNLPDSRYDSTARRLTYERVARALEALPGVRAAGGVTKLPATGWFNTWSALPLSGPLAGNRDARASDENRVVSGDYFRAVGIPIVRGRAFDDRDVPGAVPSVIVTKSLADKLFPGVDPIGQSLRTGDRRRATVVGIAGETSITNEGTPGMFVYHPHRQFAGNRNWALMQVVALNAPSKTIQQSVRSVIASIDPLLVMYRPAMLDDAIGAARVHAAYPERVRPRRAHSRGARPLRRVVVRRSASLPRVRHPHGPWCGTVEHSRDGAQPRIDREWHRDRDWCRVRRRPLAVHALDVVRGEPTQPDRVRRRGWIHGRRRRGLCIPAGASCDGDGSEECATIEESGGVCRRQGKPPSCRRHCATVESISPTRSPA
jgi:predicted permease